MTKTFTAVLTMQCRDDGLLDLDEPIGKHLDLPAHGELTVLQETFDRKRVIFPENVG